MASRPLKHVPRTAVAFALIVGAGCAADTAKPITNEAPAPTASSAVPPPVETPAPADADAAVNASVCSSGTSVCTGKDRRRTCTTAGAWVDETCPAGSGCFKGACVVGQCSDECTLGEAQGTKTCALWSVADGKGATAAPASKLHDRARDYLGWMKRGPMLAEAIGSPTFSDPPSYTKVTSMGGIGDAAIWTGAFLASEGFRLQVTGAADARARVRSLVETVHYFLSVAGEPGVLARWATTAGKNFGFAIPDWNCSDKSVHCGVDYAGKKHDYIGHISRDQYQGVMLGLVTAYDALTPGVDDDLRAVIRTDIVTIVKELMKERSMQVRIDINGIVTKATVPLRFAVVSPREMIDGAVDLHVDLKNPNDSEMYGFQEFYPNLADLVHHLPGFSWVPEIKRAASAIMLAAFFRAALHVTENVPEYASDHAAILSYYTSRTGESGNVNDWLAIAAGWVKDNNCGGKYYSNNIAMMPMYTLGRLEDDPARAQVVKAQILGAKLWPVFENTKNSFFSFIYAGVNSTSNLSTVTSSAATQLAQFPAPPRFRRAVDLRNDPKYTPHEPDCADQVTHATAVDVGDRMVTDFLWQRQPWGLFDYADASRVEPGVDYLIAYFMGRHHGFIADDTAGACLAWQ